MALIILGSSEGGFLIALTTLCSCALELTTFGSFVALESPVTRGCSSHFIFAIKSIMAAFIFGSVMSGSVLVCGVELAELAELRF